MGKLSLNKLISLEEAAKLFRSGMTVMCGGFGGVGLPYTLVHALAESDATDLCIVNNDAGRTKARGIAEVLHPGKTAKLITTYINGNGDVSDMIQKGELQVELVPIGTLVERIRSAGAGLGGVLTPTGVGTAVENGKRVVEVRGRKYLLEEPLSGDIAIIRARKADKWGNLYLRRQQKSHNIAMATAAKTVIAQVDELVEVGELSPDDIDVPCVLVDYMVMTEE